MDQGVRPEARRYVRVLQQTAHVLLGDSHCSFRARCHGVRVRSRWSNGDSPRGAQGLEARAR
eukprot:2544799-Rhodomonas_salina.1